MTCQRTSPYSSLRLVAESDLPTPDDAPKTAADWSYDYGEINKTEQRSIGFEPIPHFTGTAWQGGPKWPDSDLGWVSLTLQFLVGLSPELNTFGLGLKGNSCFCAASNTLLRF